MVAGRAGNLLQVKRHVRLCPEIKLHIGMDGEGVKALLADASPVTVGPHESFINTEAGLFADSALHRTETAFDFLLAESHHSNSSITASEIESQPSQQSRENA